MQKIESQVSLSITVFKTFQLLFYISGSEDEEQGT